MALHMYSFFSKTNSDNMIRNPDPTIKNPDPGISQKWANTAPKLSKSKIARNQKTQSQKWENSVFLMIYQREILCTVQKTSLQSIHV